MNRINLVFKLTAIALLGFSVSACTAENTYVTTPIVGGASLENHLLIPAGISLDGTNEIFFYPTEEGLVVQSRDTSAVAVSPGSFNGGGLGNKGIVGIKGKGGTLVSEVTSIEIEARQDRGVSQVYLNLQVDCDGDGVWTAGVDTIVTSDVSTLPAFTLTSTFTRITANAADPIWMSVGALCGLPGHLSSTGLPLSTLPATAKLFDGQTGDGGMPRATDMSSVMFIQGDSGTRSAKQYTLREFKVNSQAFKFYDIH